ncbi:serine hydrolase [Micromonospora sp. CPCC 206060]|uniref:serine hydrolase n=1 Tax=Micromonospora sp. CPCC 206060 TaxID=3122406 RepID=UPI002FEEBCE3
MGSPAGAGDNTAADLLMRVGPDVVPLLAAELGLTRTRMIGGPRQVRESMFADVGARDAAEFARIFATLPEERIRALRVFDPEHTTSSTAREITRLLALIWRDEAGPAPDVAMLAVPSTDATHEYVPRLLAALDRPATVVPVHWDNVETELKNAPPVTGNDQDRLDRLLAAVRKAAPRTRILLPQSAVSPRH